MLRITRVVEKAGCENGFRVKEEYTSTDPFVHDHRTCISIKLVNTVTRASLSSAMQRVLTLRGTIQEIMEVLCIAFGFISVTIGVRVEIREVDSPWRWGFFFLMRCQASERLHKCNHHIIP
jgi:hypothetical protein